MKTSFENLKLQKKISEKINFNQTQIVDNLIKDEISTFMSCERETHH